MANQLDDFGRAWVSWSDAIWTELDQLAAQTFAEHAVLRSFFDVSSSEAYVVEIDGHAQQTKIRAPQVAPERWAIDVTSDSREKLRRHVIDSAQRLAELEDKELQSVLTEAAVAVEDKLNLTLFVKAHQMSGKDSALVTSPSLRANMEREVGGVRLRSEVEAEYGGTIAVSRALGAADALSIPRQPRPGALVLSYGPRVRVTGRSGDRISFRVELRSAYRAYEGHHVAKIISTGEPKSDADVLEQGLVGLAKAIEGCCEKREHARAGSNEAEHQAARGDATKD